MQLPDYFVWHFVIVPNFLLKVWRNFFVFIEHFFSIRFLLKTLFAPWRRVRVESKGGLKEWFEGLVFNLISQVIGAFVRFFLILWGLLFLILNFLLGIIFIVVWFFLPVFTLPLFLITLSREKSLPAAILNQAGEQFGKLLYILMKKKIGLFVFQRLSIDVKDLESLMGQKNSKTEWQEFIKNTKNDFVDIFYNLVKGWSAFNKFLFDRQISTEQIKEVALWFERQQKQQQLEKRFWELENLLKIAGLGRNFAFGYTPLLDQYAEDLTLPKPFSHQLVGREKEIGQIEQVLARTAENNCLLVGEPGVGKKTIILGFSKQVAEGKVGFKLGYKKVLNLLINNVLAAGKSLPEMKEKLSQVFKEAIDAGNIILSLENIDLYATSLNQRINLTDVFSQFFASNKIQVVATTTPEAFAKYIFPNSSLLKLFEKIEVAAPTSKEALTILTSIVYRFERQSNILVTYQALEEIIKNSDRFITEIPFPEKAIDVLDETIVSCLQKGKKIVLPSDVDEIISQKAAIPVGEIGRDEKEKLVNLEKFLDQQIVNQKIATNALIKAMKRSRLGVSSRGKPIGTFLFLGPTGVGKTETAKALAKAYFGSSKRMIRLDMSNFQGQSAVEDLIGSSKSDQPGVLIKEARENRFSVLLLDEIEKASREALNLFLTILDEGYLKDVKGKTVSFEDMIIIGTSNAAAEFIRQKVSQKASEENLSQEVVEFVLQERIFSPEFVNRFDGVIVFQSLSFEHLLAIAKLLLGKLTEKMKNEKELTLSFFEAVLQKIASDGFKPEFGARPMKRVISEQIENLIAEKILSGEVQRGSLLNFTVDKENKILLKIEK